MRFSIFFWLIQLLSFIAFFLSLLAYHRKKKKEILIVLVISNILNFFHYFFLGAFSGCVTKFLAILRDTTIVIKEKYHLPLKGGLIVFLFLYLLSSVLFYQNIFSLFPLLAAMIYVIAIWNGNDKLVRKTAFFCYFLWLCYNICVLSIAGVITNIISIISTGIAIVRNKNEKG